MNVVTSMLSFLGRDEHLVGSLDRLGVCYFLVEVGVEWIYLFDLFGSELSDRKGGVGFFFSPEL